MDLIDIIAEKRFVGQEFLTWLWFKSEERGGSVDNGFEDVTVVFEKHMLLEFGEGESNEKVVCSGMRCELAEARTGLSVGKKLEQAKIKITHNNHDWSFILAAALMEFRSVKLPKTAATEIDNGPEEVDGLILERVYLFEELERIVDTLFEQFIHIRIGENWNKEVLKIKSWISSFQYI